jgi:hypothetical protein
VKADGQLRIDRRTLDLAGRGIDAGGDVGGDHGCLRIVDRTDRARRGVAGRAGKPGAEDRVDNDPRPGQRVGDRVVRELAHDAVEALQVGSRVAGELGGRPEQQHLDIEPGGRQVASGDQPVAAVVALAADDPGGAVPGDLDRALGDRAPGGLHQLQRGHTALVDRPGVDRAHALGVVEGLEPALHLSDPSTPAARRSRRRRRSPARVSD